MPPGRMLPARASHGDRRIPLVYGLGPRHHDQPGGPGAGHRAGIRKRAGFCARFAQYIRDGLIPNMFPEGEKQGLYHTADASLWFFHAVGRYLDATSDRETLRTILPKLREIADAHIAGTRFGIHVDPSDGLLVQGQEGYQLTWMDAKVGDWVVTPRRGKAVEINALWYNALCHLAEWVDQEEGAGAGAVYRAHAQNARAIRSTGDSGIRKAGTCSTWWTANRAEGPGDDPLCRPNQLFAISLENPGAGRRPLGRGSGRGHQGSAHARGFALAGARRTRLQAKILRRLAVAGCGLPQGTVWGWLIGPYVDAWRRSIPTTMQRSICCRDSSAFGPGLHRLYQRNFRLRSPHTPARLYRPSLERGRGPALLRQTRGRQHSGKEDAFPERLTPKGQTGRNSPARAIHLSSVGRRLFHVLDHQVIHRALALL